MRIGIIDIDTSHPENWIPIERELGHEVVAVWDGGSVHPAGYVSDFARKHAIERVCRSLEEMIPLVDLAIIHGVDWDTHLDKALPFVQAGKAVLIDKPFAGNLINLQTVESWLARGGRVAGGSSLWFAEEVQEYHRTRDVDDPPQTVFCGCGVDEFNYGIHGYTLACALMGSGALSVRHLGQEGQRRVLVRYPGGRTAILAVGAAKQWLPYYATAITRKGVWTRILDHNRLYRSFLTAVLPYLSGEVAQPPVLPRDLLQPERIALAAQLSWRDHDREVPLDDTDLLRARYDGAAFARQYRAARYP